METNDAPVHPGRHTALTPDRPPVSRRELRAAERPEISAAEFEGTGDGPVATRGHLPAGAAHHAAAPARDPRPAAAAHHAAGRKARPPVVARRTAISMAGSGVALIGIAAAAHKAPDSQ